MIVVGIDVGVNGGIFAMTMKRVVLLKEAIPRLKNNEGVDYNTMWHQLQGIVMDNILEDIIFIIEDVHSLYGMSAKSNFSFGHIKGVKEGMMVALGVEYHLVQPKVWQKAVWEPEDIVLKDNRHKDTKASSLNAARRIFPDVDFRRSERAKVPHDGIVDGALMAEYCRIINE